MSAAYFKHLRASHQYPLKRKLFYKTTLMIYIKEKSYALTLNEISKQIYHYGHSKKKYVILYNKSINMIMRLGNP